MVTDGVSLRRIKSYLRRWCAWWVRTAQNWQYRELMKWFIQVCSDTVAKNVAETILREEITLRAQVTLPESLDFHAIA